MRLRMLVTMDGSEDGARLKSYTAGLEYAFGPASRSLELAEVFLREGWAEDADVPSTPNVPAPEGARKRAKAR